METRATCLNCMDGRVQLPVLTWIKAEYPVDFVDVIMEAGFETIGLWVNDSWNVQRMEK